MKFNNLYGFLSLSALSLSAGLVKRLSFLLIAACFITTFDTAALAAEDKEVLYWVAPMDPQYRRDKPGKSPMGMDLIPVYAETSTSTATDGGISISPVLRQNLGVRTATAELSRLWRAIDTVGYVAYDESMLSHIHLRTEGWIENLVVKSTGSRVKKGEFLFEVYSPKLVNAQEELLTALASANKGLIAASKQRLSALGVGGLQIEQLQEDKTVKQRISIYAPQDGVVSDLAVREGMFVNPSMKIMTLANLSSIWLLAEVYERQAAWLQVGQAAEVTLSSLPGELLEANIEYIYPELDPVTRTMKVRLVFANPEHRLKPNMYANVKIYAGAKQNIVVIPTEGLIRSGHNQRVIIDAGDGRFVVREVEAGIESGDYVEILRGVEAGEKIVVSGQFLIDSEASMRGSLQRLSANPAADGGM